MIMKTHKVPNVENTHFKNIRHFNVKKIKCLKEVQPRRFYTKFTEIVPYDESVHVMHVDRSRSILTYWWDLLAFDNSQPKADEF